MSPRINRSPLVGHDFYLFIYLFIFIFVFVGKVRKTYDMVCSVVSVVLVIIVDKLGREKNVFEV